MADDHTCSYYCERLECVLAQRNELRDTFLVYPSQGLRHHVVDSLDVSAAPAALPKGPSCCCTHPPTKMGLTFYMDHAVGPVQRVDAACPACGAVVKGLKL